MGVQGTSLQLHEVANIDLTLEGKVFPAEVTVAETFILGRDFMKAQQCTIQTQDVLLVKQHGLAIPLTNKDVRPVLSHVVDAAVQLPPHSEMEVVGRVPRIAACQTWMVEGRELQRSPVMVARAVVRPEDEEIPLRLLNWRDSPVSIPKGTAVAAMEFLPEDL